MSSETSPADPAADLVLIERADGIATVTLNRPSSRNALSSGLLRSLRTTMTEVDSDPAVDVIILTGADPAFCAGLDLKELGSTGGNLGGDRNTDSGGAVGAAEPRRPWPTLTKPLIGAINGVAVTGGFELALLCDFLVASERAAFGDTHARVGILPGWGLSVLLPQAVGVRRAVEMSLTGNFMHAEEALHFGLVNHVVAHDELLPTARKLAADIVGNNADAVQALVASYRAIHRMTVGEGERHEVAVGQQWSRDTYDPAVVEARRLKIMSRGRTQV
jgi:enoyl-CoA hydratase